MDQFFKNLFELMSNNTIDFFCFLGNVSCIRSARCNIKNKKKHSNKFCLILPLHQIVNQCVCCPDFANNKKNI